jgi:hypothetical protein
MGKNNILHRRGLKNIELNFSLEELKDTIIEQNYFNLYHPE